MPSSTSRWTSTPVTPVMLCRASRRIEMAWATTARMTRVLLTGLSITKSLADLKMRLDLLSVC
jgi:hypothetical protein